MHVYMHLSFWGGCEEGYPFLPPPPILPPMSCELLKDSEHVPARSAPTCSQACGGHSQALQEGGRFNTHPANVWGWPALPQAAGAHPLLASGGARKKMQNKLNATDSVTPKLTQTVERVSPSSILKPSIFKAHVLRTQPSSSLVGPSESILYPSYSVLVLKKFITIPKLLKHNHFLCFCTS